MGHWDVIVIGSGKKVHMCHLNSMLLALSRDPNPTKFQKTWA